MKKAITRVDDGLGTCLPWRQAMPASSTVFRAADARNANNADNGNPGCGHTSPSGGDAVDGKSTHGLELLGHLTGSV
ncbi:MAG: hypothetical protein ABL971_03460 [Vicinamibacterales bacterium]